MAETNSSETANEPIKIGFLSIDQSTDWHRLYDDMDMRLRGLCASLHMISGEGLESFTNLNDELRGAYLYDMALRTDEVHTIFSALHDAIRRQTMPTPEAVARSSP